MDNRLETQIKYTVTVTALILFLLTSGYSYAQISFSTEKDKVNTRIGNKQYKEGNYADAETSYKKALDVKNNMPEAVFNLGDAIYEQKRYEDAGKQFQLSAQTNPDSDMKSGAYHNLGNSYVQQKKWEDAVKAYKNALKQNPNDMDTKYNLAYANEMLKKNQGTGGQDDKKQQDKKEQKDSKDNQQQNQQNQDEKKQQEQQEQQQQQSKEQKDKQQKQQQSKLSKEEAEQLLQALSNEEQKTTKKMQEKTKKTVKIRIEKDW